MSKKLFSVLCIVLLLFAAGCSDTNNEIEENVTQEDITQEPVTDELMLTVSDLNGIFESINLSEANLVFYDGEVTNTCAANDAIRAGSYIEKLKNFTWKECEQPSTSGLNADIQLVFELSNAGSDISLFRTSLQVGHYIHVVSPQREGFFTLPKIAGEHNSEPKQASYMIRDTFINWYDEARAAQLFSTGGEVLTSEELDLFVDFTESRAMNSNITEKIHCFFTSFYDDIRALDFEPFMRYFPGDSIDTTVTDEEFELLRGVEIWPFKEIESLDSMPVPIHKYSRSEVDEALSRYAGITTADLDTSGVAYLEEYDSFYNYTSDAGHGMFAPAYGEKSGDIVTLWTVPRQYGATMLVLQKSGESWHILSHQHVSIK